jgi:hypothetical protein
LLRVEVPAAGFDAAATTFLPEVRFAEVVTVVPIVGVVGTVGLGTKKGRHKLPGAFSAFFVVEDEGYCYAGTVWPLAVMAGFPKTFIALDEL